MASSAADDKPTERWESMWQRGVGPGQYFDAKTSAPALKQLHAAGKIPVGTALVPGCGRGYDIELLASADRHVTGLEISSTASKAAREYLTGQGVDADNFEVQTADFFEHEGQYDFVYDYTFACALQPEQRTAWAAKQAELVKPGGKLFTLIFPLLKDGAEPSTEQRKAGPPFLWTVQEMQDLVQGAGFSKVKLQAATDSHPGREGKEWIGLWQKAE